MSFIAVDYIKRLIKFRYRSNVLDTFDITQLKTFVYSGHVNYYYHRHTTYTYTLLLLLLLYSNVKYPTILPPLFFKHVHQDESKTN